VVLQMILLRCGCYERNLKYSNEVCVCFVDHEKAFDQIDWVKLLDSLGNMRVD